jgi:DNA invertase Pin-like site-specific DNA recombinase
VDTSTPAGKAEFQMMGVFAEFERAMIRGRVKSGLERARRKARSWDDRQSTPATKRQSLTIWVKARPAIIKLAVAHGVGVGTVQRIKASLNFRVVA